MKKVVFNILIIIYVIVVVIITYSLLSYNEYNIIETKNKYILTLKEPTEGIKTTDLLVIKKENNLKTNDYVFYYDTYAPNITVKLNKIKNIEKINNTEQEIQLENNLVLSSENILGKKSNTKTYLLLGAVLTILTSKWGYLFIIIFPMLLAFIYEIYAIAKEISSSRKTK